MREEPCVRDSVVCHVQRLLACYRRWTGRELLAGEPGFTTAAGPLGISQLVFDLPFVVVSHGGGDDPIFNYGNRCAQTLWELDWDAFTRLPSRQSAEPGHVAERQGWLDRAARDGYVTGCHGVRISSSGRRFRISNVTIWNLVDDADRPVGQAATYRTWEFL